MDINSESVENVTITEDDQYFKSKAHRYVFALAELDGESREIILEITKELYNNNEMAKAWRDKILKIIHPDICKIDGATKAMTKLNEIYSRMIEDE